MSYWYAKFCTNMLVTDDSGNAQSLNSACITSDAIFSHLSFDEIPKM